MQKQVIWKSICWICHQEIFENTQNFFPCLCKGSIGSVHKECLNEWVKQKYISIENKILGEGEIDENIQNNKFLEIVCPNCKFPYDYSVSEKKNWRKIINFKFESKEKFSLLILLVIQLLVLFLDLKQLFEEYKKNESLTNKKIEVTHFLHIFTVIIIICAGGFNLIDLIGKEIIIKIKNKADI